MEVLCHHIYEYKKGLRSLILHTMTADKLEEAVLRLEKHNIDYIVRFVSRDKVNIFFGDKNCVELINSFGIKPLNAFTDEEDFILGVLLGYDKIAECERYLSRKKKSKATAAPTLVKQTKMAVRK